jgi:hypothetical protein
VNSSGGGILPLNSLRLESEATFEFNNRAMRSLELYLAKAANSRSGFFSISEPKLIPNIDGPLKILR